jgi:predicted CXXCH cytochrome family protein
MLKSLIIRYRQSLMVFILAFSLCLALGVASSLASPAKAAPDAQATPPVGGYAGAESCKQCHEEIYNTWLPTRHSQAFSSPIFQRDWSEVDAAVRCLECHTTGYDPKTGSYSQQGVTCESCHGPFQPNHPLQPMTVTPNAELCSTCHKTTTDEWRASVHSQNGVQCQACHNPHSQTPKAATVTELCSNCHKERGDSFTHSTHAVNKGLECSNCHMYTGQRLGDNIGGLEATGHTFSVGSDTCVACHRDTVHTRDEIVKLTGEVSQMEQIDVEAMEQKLKEQETTIANLEARNDIRLYTGLAQGAIIGLITGGVAAWVVSRRIRVMEVDVDE